MTRRASVLCLLSLLTLGCGDASPPQVGDVAPHFELQDLSNSPIKSDSLKGRPVVLGFWSPTCQVCLKEIETLKAVQRNNEAQVVAIAIDGSTSELQSIARARDLTYTILKGSQEVFTQFDGYTIPYTLVLDRDWKIQRRFTGRVDETKLDKAIESAKGQG